MTESPDVSPSTSEAEADEAQAPHTADRAPTAEEEQSAERVAAEVDVAEVGGHFDEMAGRGANVKGEGQIP